MAIFNKREVGYIKAIAGVGSHKTLKHSRVVGDLSQWKSLAPNNSRVDNSDKLMKAFVMYVDGYPFMVDASDTGDFTTWTPEYEKASAGYYSAGYVPLLNALKVDSVAEGDETKTVSTDERVGEDFYLNATHMKMRFTMPDFGSTGAGSDVQPHHEYRLIIFRNRHAVPNSPDDTGAMDSASYLNWNYDLFNGYVGRRIGLQGYRKHEQFDNDETYSGNIRSATDYIGSTAKSPTSEPSDLTPDDWMTLPLNDTDYVIHTDERFFLGREHGKSHYEKVVRFDWRERGSTSENRLSDGLREGFNTNWVVLMLATTNDTVVPNVNYHITQTTSLESA